MYGHPDIMALGALRLARGGRRGPDSAVMSHPERCFVVRVLKENGSNRVFRSMATSQIPHLARWRESATAG